MNYMNFNYTGTLFKDVKIHLNSLSLRLLHFPFRFLLSFCHPTSLFILHLLHFIHLLHLFHLLHRLCLLVLFHLFPEIILLLNCPPLAGRELKLDKQQL